MREKAKHLVYLDSERYLDIDSIKILPWAEILLPIMILVISHALHWTEMIVAVCVYFFSSLFLIRILQSKRIKKTFRLRFLVNGIGAFYTFVEILLLIIAISVATESKMIVWFLTAVFLFIVLYIGIIVYMVHIDAFKKIKKVTATEKFQKKVIKVALFLFLVIGIGGVVLRFSGVSDTIKMDIVCLMLSFVLIGISLGFINFVQYFYCVKHGINCDETGNDHSPKLEPSVKEKSERTKKRFLRLIVEKPKSKLGRFLKIMVIVLAIPVVFYLLVFFYFLFVRIFSELKT